MHKRRFCLFVTRKPNIRRLIGIRNSKHQLCVGILPVQALTTLKTIDCRPYFGGYPNRDPGLGLCFSN